MLIVCMHLLCFMMHILIEISVIIMHILIKIRTKRDVHAELGFPSVSGIRCMHFLSFNCVTSKFHFEASFFFALNELYWSSLVW